MKLLLALLLLALVALSSFAQEDNTNLVGGPCEGCEAIFEYGNKTLNAIDTLPDYNDEGLKIKLIGTIYQNDGKTPASNIILYIYHTDQKGIYATRGGETGWAKRHGYIRGWIKTGKDGKYIFLTLKPGSYPGGLNPAHIHPTILEPNGKYYWLGAWHFRGDAFLTEKEISPESPRGGSSGLLNLYREGNLWVGERDFILGENISGYDE